MQHHHKTLNCLRTYYNTLIHKICPSNIEPLLPEHPPSLRRSIAQGTYAPFQRAEVRLPSWSDQAPASAPWSWRRPSELSRCRKNALAHQFKVQRRSPSAPGRSNYSAMARRATAGYRDPSWLASPSCVAPSVASST